jgi:hypothetical protein
VWQLLQARMKDASITLRKCYYIKKSITVFSVKRTTNCERSEMDAVTPIWLESINVVTFFGQSFVSWVKN